MPRILFVEDDPVIRRLYEVNLANAGFSVTLAEDGLDALEKLKFERPDVIISDVSMPRMDGFTLRQRLADDPDLRNIAFLFLTARSSEEDTLRGLSLDADDYIVKTAGPAMTIAKLQTLLRRRKEISTKLTDELAAASVESSVQLIPTSAPNVSGWTISFIHKAHEGVPGGDFFDFVDLGGDRWLITIADVMGKRWRAWMFAHAYVAYLRSMIRSLSQASELTPGKLFEKLNQALFRDSKTADVLCTLMSISLKEGTGEVKVANAAHLPMIHYCKQTGRAVSVEVGSTFIGFEERTLYEDQALQVEKGDRLILFTDGLTEAPNLNGEQFGVEKLASLIENLKDIRLTDIPHEIERRLFEYVGRDTLDDDLTLICLERN